MNSNLRNLVAFALTAAVLTLSAAPASAAVTRVVSPSATRTIDPCTTDTPCRLDYAMGRSVSRDDVTVLPGDYYDSGTTPWGALPRMPAYTSIHGTVGQPVPVLHGHLTDKNNQSFLKLDGATARDLSLVFDASGIYLNVFGLHLVHSAAAERIQVHGTNAAALDSVITPCRMEDYGILVDSVCIGDGDRGQVRALEVSTSLTYGSATGVIRNVTAVANATKLATGVGMRVSASRTSTVVIATNVIARGRDADILLDPIYDGSLTKLSIYHSNWRTTIWEDGQGTHLEDLGPGNQTGLTAAAPLFVDEAAGDYRQAPGSPTIDAGENDAANGLFDFAGTPRVVGADTDIGADEFFPPPLVTTGTATGVGQRVATVKGTVNPMGANATVRFQYGRTTAYGSTAGAPTPPAGASVSLVTATLAGLSPGTTYHYRVLATTAHGGTAAGADRTFRTAGSPSTKDGGGSDSGPGSGPGRDPDAAAAISALRIGKRWRLGSLLPQATRKRKAPVGTTIGFTLSKAARVTFEFSQRRTGRRVVRGRLTISAHAGRNRLRFGGRLSRGKILRPGSYLLTVRAGNASTPKRLRFTIVR